jgi:hypothetical protein
MLGKELEIQLGIKQQYRSRYDKMFSEYISPATCSPRTYNQNDINAYVIIVDCFKKGLRRIDIIEILEKGVIEGLIVKNQNGNVEIKSQKQEQEKIKPMRDFSKRNETTQRSLIALSEDVGSIREYVKILSENIADLEVELRELKNAKKEVNPLDNILEIISRNIASVEIENIKIKKIEKKESVISLAGKYEAIR